MKEDIRLNEHLLRTKLQIPPLPAHVVQRDRLLAALDRGLQETIRVTLISAPAGYGKTTLLSSWIRSRGVNTAWFSINEGDNDPARFLSYLIFSVCTALKGMQLPHPGDGVLTSDEVRVDYLVPLLNQLSRQHEPLVFVLDDYYLIQNQAVQEIMSYLLENAPPHVHFYLATRADPALPLARLRGRGQVNDLRMEDLRFGVDEAGAFFTSLPELHLNHDQIQILQRRTEGWISGLQMISVILRGREDVQDFLRSFSGSHHYIMDYLQDEVLKRVPSDTYRFLLDTSILERMTGSLCDALRGNGDPVSKTGERILRELEQANMFIIPLDDRREWYRYHRLFSDLLQAQLLRQNAARIPHLHRRASVWFEKHDLIDEAVQHALASEDGDFAADLIEKYAQTILLRSETTTYLRWVQGLPADQIRQRPQLAVYRAWSLLLQGSPLAVVEVLMEESPCTEDFSANFYALESFILMSQGKIMEGVERAEEALALLPEDEIYLRNVATICAASGRISLGDVDEGMKLLDHAAEQHQRSGNRTSALMILCETAELRMKKMHLDEAEKLYLRALELGTSPDGELLPMAGQPKMGLGAVALERFELEKAETLLLEGIALSKRWSLIGTLDGHFTLGLLYMLKGDNSRLQETLDTLENLSRRFDATDVDDVVVDSLRARTNARFGRQQPLEQWVLERELNDVPAKKPARFYEKILAARIYKYELPIAVRWMIGKGRLEQALQALQEMEDLAVQTDRPHLIIEANLLRSKIYLQQADQETALQSLQKAISLAQPALAKRQFLTEGADILELLQQGRKQWLDPALREFAGQLLKTAEAHELLSPASEHQGEGLVEGLSARELEVLRMLPSSLTAEALAGELVISVNTLRSHMKNIYSKLGVHSRHEAVVKATELDLI
ncbi:MAG: hypothetical protein JXA25_09245 [Anaerolineales bacterium]|nr:hypothetical protein [Anaerolineales bacterium]